MSPLDTKRFSLVGEILQCISSSGYLIQSSPCLMLHILKLLRSIWEGGSLHMPVLVTIRNSEMFWGHMVTVLSSNANLDLNCLNPDQKQSFAYRLQCQASVLEIMAWDIFHFGKDLDRIASENEVSLVSKEAHKKKTQGAMDVLLSLFQGDVGESLMRICSSSDYRKNAIYSAKMALNACLVHLMEKFSGGDTGSVSITLVNRIRSIANKLYDQPAFRTLLEQYTFCGYSKDGHRELLLNDLYHHLDGVLEGREITSGHFQNLVHHLSGLDVFLNNPESIIGPCFYEEDVYMFDLPCLRDELRIEFWDHSSWGKSKPVADRVLQLMHEVNLSIALSQSKNLVLRAFLSIFSAPEKSTIDRNCFSLAMEIPKPFLLSSIECLCEYLHDGEEMFISAIGPSEVFLKHRVSQIEILHSLCMSLFKQNALEMDKEGLLQMCIHVIKTASASLRCLSDSMKANFQRAVQLLLMLLVVSVEFLCPRDSTVISISGTKIFSELSLLFLGLLPALCKFLAWTECFNLSTVFMDLVLKKVLTPKTGVPVLQKHLKFQYFINKLQERNTENVSIILNFFLTLAQSEGGAQMLLSTKSFLSLKFIFDMWLHEESVIYSETGIVSCKTIMDDNLKYVFILGMAIVTSVVLNAAADSYEIMDSAISYLFPENSSVLYRCLSSSCFIIDDEKKSPRMHNEQRSLTTLGLREAEHVLMLICALAKHRTSWAKGMAEHEFWVRETCIHMLSFISKANQSVLDSSNVPLLFCHLTLKEVKDNETPAFVGSKSGWFAPSCLGISKSVTPAIARTGLFPVAIKSGENGRKQLCQQSHFTDMVSIQLYKITFFTLNFFCMQSKAAAKRAEDIRYIDLDQFPGLPRPEILHGIQDQAIRIVIDICQDRKSDSIQHEVKNLCSLLLQILERSLYLEFCVLKTCGIRPVSGRIEDFSKEIKTLIHVVEEHAFLKASLKPLGEIIGPLYPNLVATDTLA